MNEEKPQNEFTHLSLEELRDKRDELAAVFKQKVLDYLDNTLIPFLEQLKTQFPEDEGRIHELIILVDEHKSRILTNAYIRRPQSMFTKLNLEWTVLYKRLVSVYIQNQALKQELGKRAHLREDLPDKKTYEQLEELVQLIQSKEGQ